MKHFIWLVFLLMTFAVHGQCDLEVETVIISTPSAVGSCDGEIQPFLQGGVPPYMIFYYDCLDSVHTGIQLPIGTPFSNLCAGNHAFVVYDAVGCADTSNCVSLPDVPDSLCSLNLNYTNAVCFDQCTGFAMVNANGTAPINYLWSTGETLQVLSNVCAGYYFVTIQDSNNCIKSDFFTITEPAEIHSELIITSGITATGSCDASLSTAISGGTPPYYPEVLNCLDSTTYPFSPLTNFCAGEYALIVYDDNLCMDTSDCITITDPVANINSYPDQLAYTLFGRSIQFNYEVQSVLIYDTQGRSVFKIDQLQHFFAIPQSIASGCYIMIVETKHGQQFSEKLHVP